MFFIHQIVNVLINPIFAILLAIVIGLFLAWRGWRRTGRIAIWVGLGSLFLLSWPPLVDVVGLWLEKDYPIVKAEDYPHADAIIVLGGGVGYPPEELRYPYPTLADAADRAWFGALLWHEQAKTNASIKIYCTGPDVSRSTPPFLRSLGVADDSIVALDGPLNTEEEAKRYEEELAHLRPPQPSSSASSKPKVLLVTSAMHMKRAEMIFKKYAPSLDVIPAPTDHHFFDYPARFKIWHYYFPNIGALCLSGAIEHELIGILRYCW